MGPLNMADTTLWWLLTGGAVAVELLTGTFYLLMLALGMAAAAVSAHLGVGLATQLVIAAAVGGGAVLLWHYQRLQRGTPPSGQSNPSGSLDVGETVQISNWHPDGTADLQYRGAHWIAIHRPGVVPSPGTHRVAELVGNRLMVDKE
jgi:membrane protein implicated in regulation of membrane protease activity